MTTTIDDSPEWRQQTRVERATVEPSDPAEAAYFRLYRRLEEPLPVAVPADLADRIVQRRSREIRRSRLQWAMLVVLSVGVIAYGLSLSVASLFETADTPAMLWPDIEWSLIGFAVLVIVAGGWWVGRRNRAS